MDRISNRLSSAALKGYGSELAMRAYAELKANDNIEDKLKILKRDGSDYKVSQLGGTFAESDSLSMISDANAVSMGSSVYMTKRLLFAPKRGASDSDIKYAVTGFTESVYNDNYSKAAIINSSTGKHKNASEVLIGGNTSSLMVLDASAKGPNSEIYFNYGEGEWLGSLKLELTSEKISQKDIKDAFLQGYNKGGVEEGVTQLLELAKQNFENYVCMIYPDLRLLTSESAIDSNGYIVSKDNSTVINLPIYVIFYSMGTSFITVLSKATPGKHVRNNLFRIRRSDIKRVSNSRPYLGDMSSDTRGSLYG
ncbi:MAG: hypothetical protein QXR73_03725 [Candidatus Micrarchaeaceae archaeon]